MTIGTTYDKIVDYAGNGSTTVFSTDNGSKSFPVFQATASTHEMVVKTKVVATGVETTLTENSDYTVSLTGTSPSLANITFSVAPPTGTNVYLINDIQLTQGTDFNATGTLDLDSITTMADKQMLISQLILSGQNDLAVQVSDTSGLEGITLGTPVSEGLWKWNTAADNVEFKTIDELVSSAAFDISALTVSTSLVGTDHLPGYDVSLSSQVKATINDVVEAGLLGLTSISDEDKDTIKTNLGIGSTAPEYKILQADTVVLDTNVSLGSVTADELNSISGFNLNFTPVQANSTILIYAQLQISSDSGGVIGSIFRDGINLANGKTDILSVAPSVEQILGYASIGSDNYNGCISLLSIDKPDTTEQITYSIRGGSTSSTTVEVNASITDSNTASYGRPISNMVIIEISN